MKIAGYEPFTLTDYPGKIAAIVFTQGCNFRCPFCHNGALLPAKPSSGSLMPEDSFFDFLRCRQDKLDGVVVTGGEPTLQFDLEFFIQKIKAMGFLVKLDTNGSRPHVVKKLLDEKLLDFIAMDIKSSFESYDRLAGVKAPIKKIQESIQLIASSGVEHQFRTTFVEPLMDNSDLEKIKEIIPNGSWWVKQKFKPENAFDKNLTSCAEE